MVHTVKHLNEFRCLTNLEPLMLDRLHLLGRLTEVNGSHQGMRW
jgi:hypothetical protein